VCVCTGVNPSEDAGDTSPIFWLGDVNGNIPPILLRTFGYSRPILVALRSLSLKPISFGYKTPPIRFSQAGGQSAPSQGSSPQPSTRVDIATVCLQGEQLARWSRPPARTRARTQLAGHCLCHDVVYVHVSIVN